MAGTLSGVPADRPSSHALWGKAAGAGVGAAEGGVTWVAIVARREAGRGRRSTGVRKAEGPGMGTWEGSGPGTPRAACWVGVGACGGVGCGASGGAGNPGDASTAGATRGTGRWEARRKQAKTPSSVVSAWRSGPAEGFGEDTAGPAGGGSEGSIAASLTAGSSAAGSGCAGSGSSLQAGRTLWVTSDLPWSCRRALWI